MSYIDTLNATVKQLEEKGGFGQEGINKGETQIIDGDTVKDNEGSIRLSGIDTAETPHIDPYTLDYAPGGEIKGILQTGELANLVDQGFDKPYRSGKRGFFGRDLGDLVNEEGTSATKTLLQQGLADPSRYATSEELDVTNFGNIDRAQRAYDSKQNDADKRREALLEASSLTMGGDPFQLKDMAASEAHYAAAPGFFRGVALEQADRNIMNETVGWQLDDAFSLSKSNGKVGGYAFAQLMGDLVNLDSLSKWGEAHSDRLKREMEDLPQLRDMNAFDENGQWTLDGISEFSNYVFSNVAASAALMGVTIASVAAAPFTWGTTLSIPAAMYSGMTYDAQNEKDIARALTSGVFQAALDVIGVKGLNPTKLFNKAGRKDAIALIADQKNITEEAAEKLLSSAVKGQTSTVISAQKRALSSTMSAGRRLGAGGARESITEATQEALAIWGEGNAVTPQEVKNRLLNALVAGGVLGTGFTGVAEISTGIAQANIRKGSELTSKTELQLTADQDMKDYNYVLDVKGAIGKLDSEKVKPILNGPADKTTSKTLKEQAKIKKKKNKSSFIDNVSDAIPLLWKGQLKNKLSKYKSGKYGSMLYSSLVGKNGRAGRNYEESRRQYSADILDNKYLDAIEGASSLGFQNSQEVSLSVKKYQKQINSLLRRATSLEDLINLNNKSNEKIDSRLLPLVSAIFEKNSFIKQTTGIRDANLLEKTFNKSYIYRNQPKFIQLLKDELGVDAQTATDITQSIIKNEDYANPDDALNTLLNLAKGNKKTKSSAKFYAQYKDSFNEFLHADISDNIQANAVKFGNTRANQEYIGSNGSKLSKALDLMSANGEIDADQKAELANDLSNFLEQVAGEYNRVDNRMYNTALNNISFLTMIAALPLAAISSLTESALVVFSSPKPMQAAWVMSQVTAKEFIAISNEALNSLSNGRIPMQSYLHREQLRKAGYLLETQGAAARLGAEASPSQARFVQKFFKINGLTSLTNIQRATGLQLAEDAIEHWVDQAVLQKGVNNRLYTEAHNNLSFLGVNPDLMINYKEDYHKITVPNRNVARVKAITKEKYLEQVEVAKNNFVDQRVAQPFKGNRPAFYSDPRFRLFTMFQGFISTFTANILPTLYGQAFSTNSLPKARVQAMTTMAAMIAFTYFAQNLKDLLKGKDEEDELPPFKEFVRTMYGTGLIGTAERPLNAIMPLYGNSSSLGTSVDKMLGNTAGAITDSVIGESPQLDYIDNGLGMFFDALEGDNSNIARNAVKATPANVFKNWFTPIKEE